MAGKGFVNLELFQFAENVVLEAKRNTLVKVKGRSINSTGRLRKSIRYEITRDNDIKFYMESYGAYVDSGRDGTKQRNRTKKGLIKSSNAGAFPNVGKIRKWINDKPIKARDLKTGQFVKRDKKTLDQMTFLIGRKILEKGIKPTYFFSDALRKYSKTIGDDIVIAVLQDFDDKLNNKNK